jgi:hypothetical protein
MDSEFDDDEDDSTSDVASTTTTSTTSAHSQPARIPVRAANSEDEEDDATASSRAERKIIVSTSSPAAAVPVAGPSALARSAPAVTSLSSSSSSPNKAGEASSALLQRAIQVCRETILNTNETFVGAWHVTFVNQWGKEQERILVLSSKNLFRVNFDFKADAVVRYDRTDLVKVDAVHKGWLRVAGWRKDAELTDKLGKKGQRLFGLRVLAGDNKNAKLTDKEQYMRTFCAHNASDDGKSVATEIANAIWKQVQARTSKTTPVTEVDIVVPAAPLSSLLSWGISKK